MTPSRFRWGILFITAGVMLLLNNSGYLDWDYWVELLMWWPLLLIAIGLEKMFLRSRLQFISYAAPLILVVGMVYVAFDTGTYSQKRSFFSRFDWSEKADPSIERLEADVNHGHVDLYVSRTSLDLVSARFDRFLRKPRIEFSKSGNIAELEIKQRGTIGGAVVIHGRRYGRDWRVSVSDDVPLKLRCIGDESDVSLDMESVPLEDITIENDEGDIYLKIGKKRPQVNISVSGDDVDLRLKIPEGCGIQVLGDEYASYLKAFGLQEDESGFHTDGFDTATVKLSVELGDLLRHLSIGYY